MTRQFHARDRRPRKPSPRDPRQHTPSVPKRREPRQHTVSFKCFRFVPIDEPGPDAFEIIELCDPRNAMRAFLFER